MIPLSDLNDIRLSGNTKERKATKVIRQLRIVIQELS